MANIPPTPSSSLTSTLAMPKISARFLVPIFRYLHKHHPEQATQYLQQFQLQEDDFESEIEVGMDCFQNILEQAAIDCNDPNIGLHIYEELEFNELGVLGYAINSLPTIGKALELHRRYYHLFQTGAEVAVRIKGDKVYDTYRNLSPALEYSRQDTEISSMYTIYLIRKLSKPDWRPLEAHFQHAQPDDISEHKRLICDDLYFDQPTNVLVFDKATLDLPINNANEQLANTLKEALRRIDKINDNSEDFLLEKVQQEIVAALPEALPTINEIAAALNQSARTLQRRLSDQGYSFKKLVDITRQNLAAQYLKHSNITATEIAFLLCYSESSAFDRAFKRWFNTSPLEYRKTHKT